MSTPITLTCACGRQLQARSDAAGKRVRCPYCNRTPLVPVPALETLVDFDPARAQSSLTAVPSPAPQKPSVSAVSLDDTEVDGFEAPSPEPITEPAAGPLLAPPHPRRLPRSRESGRPPEYRVIGRNDDWFQGDFNPNDLEEALNSYVAQGWSLHTIFTFRPPGSDREEVVVVLER